MACKTSGQAERQGGEVKLVLILDDAPSPRLESLEFDYVSKRA